MSSVVDCDCALGAVYGGLDGGFKRHAVANVSYAFPRIPTRKTWMLVRPHTCLDQTLLSIFMPLPCCPCAGNLKRLEAVCRDVVLHGLRKHWTHDAW